MRTLQEAQTFCNDHLLPDLHRLEASRKRAAVTGSIAALGVLVLAILLAIRAIPSGPFVFGLPLLPFAIVFGIIFAVVMCVLVFAVCTQPYRQKFKRLVIARLVGCVEEGLSYDPKGFISEDEFRMSGVFRSEVDSYSGEDLVCGWVGRTEIRFSEVHAQRRDTHTDSKGRSHTRYETIFSGVFLVADFNKDFQGRTLVLPDVAQRLLGRFGQRLQAMSIPGMQLIRLEDLQFEQEFVVYGTDQIEARYILSPALMQRILSFKRKVGATVYLSFANSRLYMAIEAKDNLFEPKIFSSLLDVAFIEDYYQQLALLIGVVDDMNLNTRIWSKQ